MRSQKFAALDLMRGLAAVAVLVFHFRSLLPHGEALGFSSGYLAVDFFFVLSGFVLAHAYDRRLGDGGAAGAFMVARLIRLLPMIWLGTLIGAALMLAEGRAPGVAVLQAAVLLPSHAAFSDRIFPLNTAEWSLFYEVLANLVFAFAFRFLSARVVAAIVAACAIALTYVAVTAGALSGGSTWPTMAVGLARVGFSFFVGVQLRRTLPDWSAWVPRLPWWAPAAILVAVLEAHPSPALRPAYDLGFVLLVSPLLLALGAQTRGAPVTAATALGLMSYPLYAIHAPVRDAARWAAAHYQVRADLLAAGLVVLLPVVAWMLARTYDEPVRAWLSGQVRKGARLQLKPRV